MRLHFTAGYHPSADGQTERVNQTLEQYIRMYCNYQQNNWSPLLPLGKFAYNNAPNVTTGVTPFFAKKGYHPSITIHPERDLTSARARDYVTDLDALHHELRTQMTAAQKCYQGPADSRQAPDPKISIGDEVYINTSAFRTARPSRVFSEKFYGPYEIIVQPGPASFSQASPRHAPDSPSFPYISARNRNSEYHTQAGATPATSGRGGW